MRRLPFILLVLLVLLAFGSLVLAQTGEFNLPWYTVDGGGVTSSRGGDYTLSGTIGQPDAGALSGGDFTLAGGWWGDGTVITERGVYLPLITR